MNKRTIIVNFLQAGFARVNITTSMGISVAGYFIPRYADGVLDELEINALAVSLGRKKAIFIRADLLVISNELYDEIKKKYPTQQVFPRMKCF